MYGLLIDAVLDYLNIAIIKNDIVIDFYETLLTKNFTDIFNDSINKLLEKNKLKHNEIAKVYVINGPGSFTSTKLVCLYANTFKFVNPNVDLFTLNTLKWHIKNNSDILAIDAKTNLFYISLKTFKKPFLISLDELKKLETRLPICFYSFENKLNVFENWKLHKNEFQLEKYIRPLYIKPAIYDTNKK